MDYERRIIYPVLLNTSRPSNHLPDRYLGIPSSANLRFSSSHAKALHAMPILVVRASLMSAFFAAPYTINRTVAANTCSLPVSDFRS